MRASYPIQVLLTLAPICTSESEASFYVRRFKVYFTIEACLKLSALVTAVYPTFMFHSQLSNVWRNWHNVLHATGTMVR